MQLKKYLLNKLTACVLVLLVSVLTSCGSYQYVGQDSDGVYSDDYDEQEVSTETNKTNTHAVNLFNKYFFNCITVYFLLLNITKIVSFVKLFLFLT